MYLHKHEKVVETTLRFCLGKFCVTNISSTLHNIQPFRDDVVYKDPILSREQRAKIQVEGFIIHGSDPLEFSLELQPTILLNKKSFFIFNGSPLTSFGLKSSFRSRDVPYLVLNLFCAVEKWLDEEAKVNSRINEVIARTTKNHSAFINELSQ